MDLQLPKRNSTVPYRYESGCRISKKFGTRILFWIRICFMKLRKTQLTKKLNGLLFSYSLNKSKLLRSYGIVLFVKKNVKFFILKSVS
jgi:hypothetical protein